MKKEIIILGASLVVGGAATNTSLLPLPPMGFNNWARFKTDIKESIFVDAADAMASNGLLAAGYNRLNLDDAWSAKSRAANGSLAWDSDKFPRGLAWLSEYVKGKGFTPGIYTDAGTRTCAGYPGSSGYEEQDLQTFLDWGFEYIKIAGCNLASSDNEEAEYYAAYTKWHDLLSNSTQSMVLSNSAPAYFSGTENLTNWYTVLGWASQYGQLGRHSADIYTYPSGPAWDSVMYNYGQQVRLSRYQKVGQYFNDPDFLITDNPTLSLEEKKSQFALWCSFSAPLLLSVDIPSLTEDELAILTNKDLIAVNQDTLGQQATLVSQDGTWDVLTKSLANGDRLLTVLNRGSSAGNITVDFARLGLASISGSGNLGVTDLWTGQVSEVAVDAGSIAISDVPSHGTAVLRISLSAVDATVLPTGMIFNTANLNCLTDAPNTNSGLDVTWAACNGSDRQVWVFNGDSKLHSLENTNQCIEVSSNGTIYGSDDACTPEPWTNWAYQTAGYVTCTFNGQCLTDPSDSNGLATSATCGDELDSQVIAMPVGTRLQS